MQSRTMQQFCCEQSSYKQAQPSRAENKFRDQKSSRAPAGAGQNKLVAVQIQNSSKSSSSSSSSAPAMVVAVASDCR